KDLLQRAADVNLKERRPVVVVPRETPLSRGHLVHLLALHDAGAVVLPASPGFYAGARDVQQLVDFVAGRVLDAIGVPHDLYRRWRGELGSGRASRGVRHLVRAWVLRPTPGAKPLTHIASPMVLGLRVARAGDEIRLAFQRRPDLRLPGPPLSP